MEAAMKRPEAIRALEAEFRELVNKAVHERWTRDGRYSAKEILSDIRCDEKVWRAIADQFAERAAAVVIRRQMTVREPENDPAQEKFPFANELPVPSITYKGTIVSTFRATADEYVWFENWYERRLAGTVKRSRFDKKTLAKVKRFGRVVERYHDVNPGMGVREIIEARQERLVALRKQRSKRSQ
jgi:hypothetical protein